MQIHNYGSKEHNRGDFKLLLLFTQILRGTAENDQCNSGKWSQSAAVIFSKLRSS